MGLGSLGLGSPGLRGLGEGDTNINMNWGGLILWGGAAFLILKNWDKIKGGATKAYDSALDKAAEERDRRRKAKEV